MADLGAEFTARDATDASQADVGAPGLATDGASRALPALLKLVPEEVSRRKLARQLELWDQNSELNARRGWWMLRRDPLVVEVAFLARVAFGERLLPVVTVCTRLDYTNFDLWPPSVTFIDPITRQTVPPPVRAMDRVTGSDEVRDALVDGHPTTGLPFLCLPGVREYHSHPQHTGDDWLLHRRLGEGDLAVICERIWRRMARNVLGLRVGIQSLPGLPVQVEVALAQGDPDAIRASLAPSPSSSAVLAEIDGEAPPGSVGAPILGEQQEQESS